MSKTEKEKPLILLKVEMTQEMRDRFKVQCVLIRKSMRHVLGRLVEVWTEAQEQKR